MLESTFKYTVKCLNKHFHLFHDFNFYYSYFFYLDSLDFKSRLSLKKRSEMKPKLGKSGVKVDKSHIVAVNEQFHQKTAVNMKNLKKTRVIGKAPQKVNLNLKKVK